MIKPLVLKISGKHPQQISRGCSPQTADDVICKFSLKSPAHRVLRTEHIPSTTRSISSSLNKPFFKKQAHSKIEIDLNQKSNGFKKAKVTANVNNKTKPIFAFDRAESKIQAQKEKSSKQQKKLELNLQFLKKKQDKKIISRLVRQIKAHTNQNNKENRSNTKNISTPSHNKLQRPLTDRFQQKPNIYKQIQGFSNVKLDKQSTKNNQPQKTIQQPENSYRFLRKGSNASTLSLRTKHTVSMQQFEDYEELFSRQSNRDDKESHIVRQCSHVTLNLLEKVKSKIYSQIYSLDKKLLTQKESQREKKPITISLKRKQKYTQEKQSDGMAQSEML